MSGVHSAQAMGVDDGECVAWRGALLRGRHNFLIMPVSMGWGDALGRETAQCGQGGS